jgi:CRP-like cAMP-binding protein/PAS domain-containing protein
MFDGERNSRLPSEQWGVPMPKAPAFRKRVSQTPVAPLFEGGVAFEDPHELIATLFNSPTLGVGIIDRHLRYKAVNKALAALHGLPPRAFLGKTLREVLGNAAKPLEPLARQVFARGQFATIWRLSTLLRRRRKVHVLLDYFPLRGKEGGIEEIAFIAVGIPEGGKWEQRLGSGLAVLEHPPGKTVRLPTQPELAPRFALCAALFHGLKNEEVDAILRAARLRNAGSGQYFCRQGERTDKLYLLKTGLIKVSSTTNDGKEVLLRWVRPGEVFGLGTFTKSPLLNAWSALAAEPSEALEWDRMTIQRLSMSYPAFWPNAMWIALRWAHKLQTRVEEMATQRIEQRLARVVTDLAKQVSSGTQAVEVRVSGEELAQMIGTSLFTISKVLSRWKRLGYVQKGRKRLLILNREGVLQIAKGLVDSSVPLHRTAAIRQAGQSAAAAEHTGLQ